MRTRIFLISVAIIFAVQSFSQSVICTSSFISSDWQNISPVSLTTSNQGRVVSVWVSPNDPDYL